MPAATTMLTDEQQRTLRSSAEVRGVGLFTGASVTATLRPGEAGGGIQFRRIDIAGAPMIPARVECVVARPRRTTLRSGQAEVEMVEHCLSALAGLGVDNAVVEVNGPELPACDGSALPFVEAIDRAGTVEQDAPRSAIVITEPLTLREGDATIAALPADSSSLDLMYILDYGEDSPIGRQAHTVSLDPASPQTYRTQIAPARTYSAQSDAEAMWERGLFKHLSPKDMLVIGAAGPIDNSYRFPEEPVRHKLLDMIGDLALVGRPIRGRIVAMRSGHALNHRLAKTLAETARLADAGQPALGLAGAPPGAAMDIRAIMQHLPHRYPMILIDRVIEIDEDRRAVGVKNVTINEPFFQGHYPGTPIMPGVLIVEAMCQLAGLMLSQKLDRTGRIAMLLSLDAVKLRRPVTPGDQLVIETASIKATSRFGDVQCRAFVAGVLAAEARVRFMMVDAEAAR